MPRWGVHPVLEPALAALGEDDVPREIELALPARGRLSTHALLMLCAVCIEHAAPRGSRTQRDAVARLTALVQRALASPRVRTDEPPWVRDLFFARRDAEHGRGVLRIAALAAQAAHGHLVAYATGAPAEVLSATVAAVRETTKLLRRDERALHAFILAACRAVAANVQPSKHDTIA